MSRPERTPKQKLACEKFEQAKIAYLVAMRECYESFMRTMDEIRETGNIAELYDFVSYEMPDMMYKTLMLKRLHEEIDAEMKKSFTSPSS